MNMPDGGINVPGARAIVARAGRRARVAAARGARIERTYRDGAFRPGGKGKPAGSLWPAIGILALINVIGWSMIVAIATHLQH